MTMDEVACAAGVGKGTLFRHFGDRCGLLRALLDERERVFQEDFISGPGAARDPGRRPASAWSPSASGMLDHIEIQGDLLAAAENGAPGERLRHSVYAAYRAHVTVLLGKPPPTAIPSTSPTRSSARSPRKSFSISAVSSKCLCSG